MMSNKEDRIVELLEELVKWTKVTSIPHVKKLLEEFLKSPQERLAYESSDGRSSQEVAGLVKISFQTITIWWRKWIKTGLAESLSVRGGQRARRLFSLDDFGIEIQKPMPKGETKSVDGPIQPSEETEEGLR